jgi:hypothetical protein
MGGFVDWWCHLIGIPDPTAIQVATGIVGGGSALLIVLIIYLVVMGILQVIFRST